jgi:hypothetical protein
MAATATVLVVSLTYLLVSGYHDWAERRVVYAQHVRTGGQAVCEQIRTACRSKIDSLPTKSDANAQQDSASLEQSKYDRILDSYECNEAESLKKGVACDAWDPGSFFRFFLSMTSDESVIGKVVAAWLAVVLVLFTTKLLAAESHKGWARLSILIGCTMGAISIAYSMYAQLRFGEVMVVLLGAMVLGVSVPLLIRRMALWVRAGFAS